MLNIVLSDGTSAIAVDTQNKDFLVTLDLQHQCYYRDEKGVRQYYRREGHSLLPLQSGPPPISWMARNYPESDHWSVITLH